MIRGTIVAAYAVVSLMALGGSVSAQDGRPRLALQYCTWRMMEYVPYPSSFYLTGSERIERPDEADGSYSFRFTYETARPDMSIGNFVALCEVDMYETGNTIVLAADGVFDQSARFQRDTAAIAAGAAAKGQPVRRKLSLVR